MKTLLTTTSLFFVLTVHSKADVVTFEGLAPKGGAVNINPTLPYTEDGFTLTPSDTESAVFDAAAGSQFPGDIRPGSDSRQATRLLSQVRFPSTWIAR